MDYAKLKSEWFAKCDSSSDLSIILRFSVKYAKSSNTEHTKRELIELYKVCHKMATFLKEEFQAKALCHKIATLYYEIARYNEALNYFMECLRICQETGDVAGEGGSNGNIGLMYYSLGEYEKAMEYHKRDLRISHKIGDVAGEGRSYCNIGIVYKSLGQYEEAMEYHKKHLHLCQETGDVAGEGKSYCNIGNVYESLGQYEEAIEYHKKDLRICQETGDGGGEGTSYGNIGVVYKSLGQYKEAIKYHKKQLSISQETGDVAGEGRSYGNMGNVYKSLGQYEDAIEYHKKDLRICQETGDVGGEGMSYGNIGVVYRSLGQYEKAMEYHKKHLRICQETGDVAGEGRSYCNTGNVYLSLGQYEEAMEYHKKDLRICQETGDVAGEGTSYGNIANVYQLLGRYEQAMHYYKKHLRICKETGNVAGEGDSYSNFGVVYETLGQFEKAMEYHKKHLHICQETGDVAGEASSYCNTGNVYLSLGQYEEAMEYHKKYLRICREIGDVTGEGMSYGNTGNVYLSLGQYEEAMDYYKKHLRICQETGDVTGEARSYGNTGNVYLSLGQYEEAIEHYKKDLRICQETGDVAGEGMSYGHIGTVYILVGQYEQAMAYYKKSLRISKEIGDVVGEGSSYSNFGVVYQALGQYEDAIEYHKKGLRICQDTGDISGEGMSYCNIGDACFLNGDIQGAEDNLKESLRCFEEVFKFLYNQDDYKVSIVDTYIVAYRLLTDVLIASGKKEQALLVSERGRSQALRDKLIRKYGLQNEGEIGELPIDDITSLVSSSNSNSLFLSLSRKKVSIFVITQGKELYFNERKRMYFAFCFDSDRSNITLPETLMWYVIKVIEDANKYINTNPMNVCEDRSMNQDQDMYHNQQFVLGDPLSADEVRRPSTTREKAAEEHTTTRMSGCRGDPTEHSDSDSAIIESQIEQTQGNQSELTFGTSTNISNHEGQKIIALPSGETFPEECNDTSSGNSTATKQQDDDHNCDNLFNDLYQVLIAPVQEALTKPEIVIIPEGPLFFVPFAALKEKGQPFLSETKRIRLGPSLTTLKLLKECPIEKHCTKGALIVGGPITGSVMFRGRKKEFSDLPYARQEALMIGDILGVKPLIGAKATKDEVINSLKEGVAIIHIATHANAATGELLLAPGPCAGKDIPDEEDYILTIKDIYASGINAQLAVLSCCHSGRGKIKAEGVVGLTRAFLAAGARSVLASLWAVDDAATSYFMWHFYQHLKSGESACASLQHAMKQMRKTREWSHLYYWAPFFIVGDDITITTAD